MLLLFRFPRKEPAVFFYIAFSVSLPSWPFWTTENDIRQTPFSFCCSYFGWWSIFISFGDLLYCCGCVKKGIFSWMGEGIVSTIKRHSTCFCIALREPRETLLPRAACSVCTVGLMFPLRWLVMPIWVSTLVTPDCLWLVWLERILIPKSSN